MARLLRPQGDRNKYPVSTVPGRKTSLASVVLLLLAAMIVAAIGAAPSAGSRSRSAGSGSSPVGRRSVSGSGSAATGHPTGASGATGRGVATGGTGANPADSDSTPLQINVGSSLTNSLVCPSPERRVTSVRTVDEPGRPALTASTFCRHSSWYVWERIGPTIAKPFVLPDDPPIPPSVVVSRFVNMVPGSLPAALVERERFGNASLYELLTVDTSTRSSAVAPVALIPGRSPILLLSGSSLLEGSGFSCTDQSSGEVISQYDWYIVNPTTLQTDARGQVIGDPAVYLQTTVYTATSSNTFSATTDPIVTEGYRSVLALTSEVCGNKT
jgi:hypothetical protein